MKNRIKFIMATLTLALGFFFCISMVSVRADEGGTTTPTTEEQPTTTTETTSEEVTEEEAQAVVDLFIDHLQNLKWEEAEALFGWIIAYLVANFGVIAAFVIKMILEKIKETKSSDAYKQALAKLSVEHQAKVEELTTSFNNTLEALKAEIEAQNKANQEELAKLTNDQTKEIANACASITAELNK